MSRKLDKGGSVYLDLTVPDFSKMPLGLTTIALGFAGGLGCRWAVRPHPVCLPHWLQSCAADLAGLPSPVATQSRRRGASAK